MARLSFEVQIKTLQLGFDYRFLRFQLQSEKFHPLGTYLWSVSEGNTSDGYFTPGEEISLVAVDYSGTYDPFQVQAATFIGTVDINLDTFVDGMVIEVGFQEVVLSDLDPYIDFSPFSTVVEASRQTYSIGGIWPPPGPKPVPEPELPPEPEPEQARGPTRGDDILYGGAASDELRALAGDDIVLGGGGDGEIFGNAGHDILEECG